MGTASFHQGEMSEAVFKQFLNLGGIEKQLPKLSCHYDPLIPNSRQGVIAGMREQAELNCFIQALKMAREKAWEGYRYNAGINTNGHLKDYKKHLDTISNLVRYYFRLDRRADPILVVNSMTLTIFHFASDDFRRIDSSIGRGVKLVGHFRDTPVWLDQHTDFKGSSTLILSHGWLEFKRNGGLIEEERNNTFVIKNDIDFEIKGTKATHYQIL